MSSYVFYKFKARRDESRINFDGTGISVFDLKKEIILANNLGKANDFDLVVLDGSTNEGASDSTSPVFICSLTQNQSTRTTPTSSPVLRPLSSNVSSPNLAKARLPFTSAVRVPQGHQRQRPNQARNTVVLARTALMDGTEETFQNVLMSRKNPRNPTYRANRRPTLHQCVSTFLNPLRGYWATRLMRHEPPGDQA